VADTALPEAGRVAEEILEINVRRRGEHLHAEAGRVAEEILESNERPGHEARWLVKWEGLGRAHATWEPRRKIPSELLEAFEQKRMATFNAELEPLLASAPAAGSSAASGVVGLTVRESDAHACAAALKERWQHGRLKLHDESGKLLGTCFGYASYGKTLQTLDSEQQSTHTLLVTNALLPLVRRFLPGFFAIEQQLAMWLQQRFGTVVELFYAHGLRQGPDTLSSTGFAIHQDTEDYDFIEYTVVVKLTPDEPNEEPSAMRVVGAPFHFEYGPTPGASGCFRARLFHASVAPTSEREHLKIAFFFRSSVKGERLAKRALGGRGRDGADDELLAQRRAEVHARAYLGELAA
jgi:hypothetical protein